MYSKFPCAMPNSQTPITAASLGNSAQTVGNQMADGLSEMKELVLSLGGVWADSSVWGGTADFGGGSGVNILPSSGLPSCGGVQLEAVPGYHRPATPILTAPPPAAVLTPVEARAVQQPAPATNIPAGDPAACMYTAETVCEAAQRGCFAAGQVDPQQLAACAQAGWQGNMNNFPWLIARGGADNGRKVGFINKNPSGPGRRAGVAWPGLSGVSVSNDTGSTGKCLMLLGAALGIGYLAIKKGKFA